MIEDCVCQMMWSADVGSGFSRIPRSPYRTRLVADEIAAPDGFSEVLRAAHERHEIERRIERPAEPALLSYGAADRHDRHDAANPRHRTIEAARQPAAGVLGHLSGNRHVEIAARVVPRLEERDYR